jgi:hypothetical protein
MSFKELEQKHNLVNRVILACGKHPTDADINPLLEERLERFYEDAVIEGMAKQIDSALAQPEQNKPLRLSPMYEYGHIHAAPQPEQESISTNDHLCAMLRQVHDVLACTALPMKRPWVGLTDEERDELLNGSTRVPSRLIDWVEQKLKEKNT